MKRARDESLLEESGMTPPPSSLWASMSPWKPPQASAKRRRDRSVPVDALSRMMTAAVTSARLKKHGAVARLFGAPEPRCNVCQKPSKPAADKHTLRCAHCERVTGACCQRDCDACGLAFCSLCSTLNCDEQFDRVFCLSCNQEQCRG